MRRFGQVIRLKPDGAREYLRLHERIPDAVADTLRTCQFRNYSIFHRDGLLVGYYEYVGADYEGDLARMAADPATQRWWDTVKPLMEPLAHRRPGEFWADFDEVFHQD